MLTDKITLEKAKAEEMPQILALAKSLDLDCEEIHWNQFIIAKSGNIVIGIGRLRSYATCLEIATVGILPRMQKAGIGSEIIRELIKNSPAELYVTCVIPEYFKKFGFEKVEEYPAILRKKVDFCKSYDFKEDQVFVMKRTSKN